MDTKVTMRESNADDLGALGLSALQVMRLQRLAKYLHKSHENQCNYGLTERQEKNEDRAWAKVESIITAAGLFAYHQGDPRGWPIIIAREPITDNDTFRHERVCPF